MERNHKHQDNTDGEETMFFRAAESGGSTDEIAAEKEALFQSRLDFLPVAMEMLRAEFPEGYALIKDYFYSTNKVTLMYLASKYGLTKNMVRYRLRLAKEKLKEYIILHENE